MNTNADFPRTLVVITGPTASGKSALALSLARHYGCHIISADSRQIFHGLPIGTAAPTVAEREIAPHHFVDMLPLDGYYSAAQFETDVLALLDTLFAENPVQVMCGGSMMYVDAVCNGIDELPTISPEIRRRAADIYRNGGIEALRATLRDLDPDYLEQVDPNNHKRLVHAIEISLEAGVPYSSLRTGEKRRRPFRIVKMAIDMPRDVLFDRINARVDKMVADGLVEEARRVYHLRHLNSLNTVGYKELFRYFDGEWDLDTAIARIKKNTRVYAKKQMTWLHRDTDIIYLSPADSFSQALESIFSKEFEV
ncbi:MAG: tRNA (adenosine(37)-N6)-dimethylallyltransferase MiaA [Muribaculaceae bacterium]|nr:tRNA (adenosine(37)-N6)-dimethylallyltransferase MiaA [Muribaculaceae bacterium]